MSSIILETTPVALETVAEDSHADDDGTEIGKKDTDDGSQRMLMKNSTDDLIAAHADVYYDENGNRLKLSPKLSPAHGASSRGGDKKDGQGALMPSSDQIEAASSGATDAAST